MTGLAPEPNGGPAQLTVFLVAAEESGDRLGAGLMRALSGRMGKSVRFLGVGGRQMAAEGLVTATSVKTFALIGLIGVIRHLPALIRSMRMIADAVITSRPDVLVIIDSPDFTHRIARKVRSRAPAIPIVDYVCPSVWAWRPWRARSMRPYVDHVLALLPFEPAAMKKLGGPACTYVGHPLIEHIERLRPNSHEAARRFTDPPLVLVLPGSRVSEIRRLTSIFGLALALLRDRYGNFELVLPTTPTLAERVREATVDWSVTPRIVVDQADKQTAFRTARAALAKSGTVTLELALAGVPMATAYRAAPIEAAILRRMALIDTIILPNLVTGERFVPEFLQNDCTPQNLARGLLPLLDDTPERRRQIEMFKRFDEIMDVGGATPSERAADIVLDVASQDVAAPTARTYERQYAKDCP